MVSNLKDVLRSRRGRWRALLDYISTQGGGGGELSDGSVTTAKIADGAVTTNKIADNAVTSKKVAEDIPIVFMGDGTEETVKASFRCEVYAVIISGTDTTASAAAPYGPTSGYVPMPIAAFPTSYSSGATVGYIKKCDYEIVQQGEEEVYSITLEVSVAPGENHEVTYTIPTLRVKAVEE